MSRPRSPNARRSPFERLARNARYVAAASCAGAGLALMVLGVPPGIGWALLVWGVALMAMGSSQIPRREARGRAACRR